MRQRKKNRHKTETKEQKTDTAQKTDEQRDAERHLHVAYFAVFLLPSATSVQLADLQPFFCSLTQPRFPGDPYSEKLETFQPTDEGWPLVMRVHPIMRWDYAQVSGTKAAQ